MITRCDWAGTDPLYVAYHDQEWGVPVNDDRLLFEFLTLEGAQAGLSWAIILRKRENYRQAFDNFEPAVVARYGDQKVAELLSNPGIVRNRLKIAAAIQNARSFLQVQEQFGSFSAYMWAFTGGQPIVNAWRTISAQYLLAPDATTPISGNAFRWNNTKVHALVAESQTLPTDSARFREIGQEISKEFIKDMAWINIMNIPTTIPTNDYYWTGYPKQENFYAVPYSWWSSTREMIINIKPTGKR